MLNFLYHQVLLTDTLSLELHEDASWRKEMLNCIRNFYRFLLVLQSQIFEVLPKLWRNLNWIKLVQPFAHVRYQWHFPEQQSLFFKQNCRAAKHLTHLPLANPWSWHLNGSQHRENTVLLQLSPKPRQPMGGNCFQFNFHYLKSIVVIELTLTCTSESYKASKTDENYAQTHNYTEIVRDAGPSDDLL